MYRNQLCDTVAYNFNLLGFFYYNCFNSLHTCNIIWGGLLINQMK